MTDSELNRIQNPMTLENIKKVINTQRIGLLAVALAEILPGTLPDGIKARIAKLRACHDEAKKVLAAEEAKPRLCVRLRTFIGDEVIRSQFLFPAAIPDGDVRQVLAHWGVTTEDEMFVASGMEPQPMHLYRNARHVLASRTVLVKDREKMEAAQERGGP